MTRRKPFVNRGDADSNCSRQILTCKFMARRFHLGVIKGGSPRAAQREPIGSPTARTGEIGPLPLPGAAFRLSRISSPTDIDKDNLENRSRGCTMSRLPRLAIVPVVLLAISFVQVAAGSPGAAKRLPVGPPEIGEPSSPPAPAFTPSQSGVSVQGQDERQPDQGSTTEFGSDRVPKQAPPTPASRTNPKDRQTREKPSRWKLFRRHESDQQHIAEPPRPSLLKPWWSKDR